MKKRKAELARIKTLIDSDRLSTGDRFGELIVSDLDKLLHDYFDFKDSPEICIEKDRDGYRVGISVHATRIKNFVTLPD